MEINMPRETKFDAAKLRNLIQEGKTAQQIMDAFGVKKPILKGYLNKLMSLDEKFYKISGLEGRTVSGNLRFTKLGLRLSPTMLANYGFSIDDEFRCSCQEDGKILLEKI
jgi:hypothetical protein